MQGEASTPELCQRPGLFQHLRVVQKMRQQRTQRRRIQKDTKKTYRRYYHESQERSSMSRRKWLILLNWVLTWQEQSTIDSGNRWRLATVSKWWSPTCPSEDPLEFLKTQTLKHQKNFRCWKADRKEVTDKAMAYGCVTQQNPRKLILSW